MEMNAVTTDASFADDCDPLSDPFEHLGRFCPMQGGENESRIDDLDPAGSYTPQAGKPNWRYRWAMDVLDHFSTITDPTPDRLPTMVASSGAVADSVTGSIALPHAVEGLVNINTAPWPVIAALHLSPGATPQQQEAMARAIVQHRMRHGPFLSVFELNSVMDSDGVRTFANGWGTIDLSADLNDDVGEWSPAGLTGDGVIADFEQQYLMVNRASNLVSTRSDSFTCYVLLQGWRNAGTPAAELVAERRRVLVIDRSRVGPDGKGLKSMRVPAW
jgi:hypothetical protein